ncbi:hypothetical protein M6B22_08145 [Jatrophihabitans cynanchi]|uniref:PKD domain-containing protein n=1 Tax=Jatrophihabitans cynanchi TaxID=2944128 RepID=A0ABY7K1K9_9ACTN|nr:hypothetical protein [Jatrophihabitans sp. SB3-54]WAX58721.1 hypothetical protein M6B22_08145 [Jatrophihabitans sp. SB3-54]
MARRVIRVLLGIAFVAQLSAMLPAAALPSSNAQDCIIAGSGGKHGVILNGICVDGESATPPTSPSIEYRRVACTDTGAALLDGQVVGRCGPNVPRCKLLAEGGQSGPVFVNAFEYQSRKPGQGWQNESFWCPQTQVPVVVPDAATIRDRAIRLLPAVGIGLAGPSPTTLVNIQTLLWARTGTARSLGQVMVVGQPVWLKIVFDHAAWDFGDGVRASSAVPGKAYDDVGDRCAQVLCPDYYGHVYRSAGPVRITLVVSWTASYSLDAAHFQQLAGGPITGPAASTALTVRQARAVLVPNPGD